MADQEKVNFLKLHKEQISKVINRANKRREIRGIDILSESEIDEALERMKEIVDSGGRVTEYTFPEVDGPIESPRSTQNKIIPDMGPPKNKITSPAGTNVFKFDVLMCENGFVLNMVHNGLLQPFIFKNQKDLIGIFKNCLFDKLKKEKLTKSEMTEDFTQTKGAELNGNE